MTHPTTPPGDDPTRDFGSPPAGEPAGEPAAPAYPPGSASVGAAPVYPTDGYPQAGSGWPQAGSEWPQQGWPQAAPPEPPKRSMTWVWVTLAAVVVVAVVAVGAVGVVLLSRAGGGGSAAAPPSAGTSAGVEPTTEPTEDATEKPAEDDKPITMPDTVGGLKKTDNPAFAGLTDQITDQMKGMMPSSAHVAVGVYDDPDSTLGIAMVVRMDMDVMGSTDGAVAGAFGSLGSMGKVSGTRAVTPPAPLTGPGKCGNVDAQGVQMAVCVAADDDTVSMVLFMERKAKEVVPLFNKIRLDIVP